MQWDMGASIATVISAVAVVASVAYLAAQVRLNSTEIAQNSKHIEASIYHSTNESFLDWYALIAQNSDLASIWQRVTKRQEIDELEKIRLHALLSILFLALEANFLQEKLNVINRRTLELPGFRWLLRLPLIADWWREQGPQLFTPEFKEVVEQAKGEAEKKSGSSAKSA